MNKFLSLLSVLCTVPAVAVPLDMPKHVAVHQMTAKSGTVPRIAMTNTVNPALVSAQSTLFESFENADKTFPDGWTLNLTNTNDWMIYAPGMLGVSTTDGSFAAMATCIADGSGVPQIHNASWLISPEFTPKDGENLMFDLYFDVRSLYAWTTTGDNKNVDEEDGLILNRVNAENMKICISVDGGEWVVLKDLWDEYGKLGYWDIIYDYELPEFRKFSFPMSEYAGKNVKIGFCHSYLDSNGGHGMFLDAVRVSLPPIETSYSLPFGTLFWGMSNDMSAMASWALLPYYTDLTWTNETYVDDKTSSWEYTEIESDQTHTSSDNDLVTNYIPGYIDFDGDVEPTNPFTMFTFPSLTVSAPGAIESTYTYANGNGTVFAGINAELPTKDGGTAVFGLSTFDQGDEVQIYFADFDIPAWGHNGMTTGWWTNHYFDGDQGADDYAKITSNMNFFYNNGTVIVIDGVRVAASSVFADDAEFVMDIIALNEDFTMGDILASATTLGKDVVKIDDSYANYPHSVMIGFKFDKPVVVDGVNFVARISGFDSEKVTYYAPLQSYKSAPMCYGFSTLEINAPSMGSSGESMMPTAVFEDLYNSFAIYLDASYPFLKCSESGYDFAPGETEKTFAFDSSYPASELTVADSEGNLPEWIEVEKYGRLGSTLITIKAKECDSDPATAELVVSAPGVSHRLTLRQPVFAGIESVSATVSPVIGVSYFDVTGQQLSGEPEAGVYIKRTTHADGNVKVEKRIR